MSYYFTGNYSRTRATGVQGRWRRFLLWWPSRYRQKDWKISVTKVCHFMVE